jgi:hypothetical protein
VARASDLNAVTQPPLPLRDEFAECFHRISKSSMSAAGHTPRDEQPDDLGVSKFAPQHVSHRYEMRTRRHQIVHHGNALRHWVKEPPIDLVACLELRRRGPVGAVMDSVS